MHPTSIARVVAVLMLLGLVSGCVGHQQITPIPYAAPAGVIHVEEFMPGMKYDMRLFGQSWMPAGTAPKAVVLYVPGNVEHGGLIAPVAEQLALAGYGVYAVDLQGLGRSKGEKGVGYVRNHDDYVHDIADTLAMLRNRYPGLAIYGAGESLGAAVLLRGEIQGAIQVDGLLLTDPAYKPNPRALHMPDFMARFFVWSGAMWGSAIPNMPAVPSNFSVNAVACSKKTRGDLLRDPYVDHHWLPASYVTALYDTQKVLEKGLEKVHSPLLVMHGEKDGVVPVKSSREIVKRAGSTDKLLFVIPGACHAGMIEENSQPHVVRIMREWLDRHAAG